MNILRKDKFEANTAQIESASSSSDASLIAISAALQRLLRSELIPILSKRLEADSPEDRSSSNRSQNKMIDFSQLKRFANPITHLFVIEGLNPERIMGFRSKNLTKGLPIGGCQLCLEKIPSCLEIHSYNRDVLT
ncbi:MAG: hypothetical protein MHMPM18_001161 [Marteilia pararefringens]